MAKIRPVGDRVVVKPRLKKKSLRAVSLFLTQPKRSPRKGLLLLLAVVVLLDNGDRAAMDVREGDRVLFAKYGGTEFKLDGEEYLVLKENDILAIIG